MTEPTVAEATPDTAPQPEADPPELPAERPEVEVMPPQPEAQPPAVVEPPSALQRAAEEMMATPGAPGRDEFLVLATTARILSLSRGAPKAVRDDPWLAFHLALIGRDLGISPSAAIAQIDVIGEGADAQLSLSPELLNGQIKRLGLGSIVKAASSDTACTAVALLPGGRLDYRCARIWPEHAEGCTCTLQLVLGEVEFTWKDAQQAGLADGACAGPQEHTAACLQGGQGTRGKRCHQGYRAYPQRMMWWRAGGWCQSDYFPEASIGLYSPEELGAVVDPETGRPYDPATVELPEGYTPAERPPDPGDDLLAEAEEGTEMHQARRELAARIDAIRAAGEAPVAALKELWEQEDDEGRRRTPPMPHLRRRHLVRARAIVKSVEDRIKRGQEWGDEAKVAWADASVAGAGFGAGRADAQEPQESQPATEAQEEATAPGAAEGEQEAPENAESEQAARERAALEQYERDVAESADARRARAEQAAAELGRPLSDVELAETVAEEVKAMAPTAVVAELERRQQEPKGNMQAQRKQLATLIYEERRAALPAPDAEA